MFDFSGRRDDIRTIDFYLSKNRDKASVKAFLDKAVKPQWDTK